MQKVHQVAVVVCMLVVVSLVHQTAAGPAWKPQGRFGKRGDSIGYGLESEKASGSLSGLIEIPVEAMLSGGETGVLRVGVRVCTITGIKGSPLCSWAADSASETF